MDMKGDTLEKRDQCATLNETLHEIKKNEYGLAQN